ncbi:MAG: LysR family transcriptional regulator [Firmicutes bacterium]|nr:LysR family transcriptional regulator [Bacillota bacterium]
METRVLRSFIVVAKEGSITRAADILHIAQPSLSKQMKLLEEELGQKLFRRGKYKVMLTDVGERFLVRAKEIVELSDLTLSEFASKEREISGDLSIAFADGSFTGNVVDVVNSFRSAYPKVRLLFYSGGLEYIRSLTQRNVADISCNYYGSDPEGLKSIKTDQVRRAGFLMRPDDPLTEYSELSEDICRSLPVIMPRGTLYDEKGKDLAFPVEKENVVALVEEPFAFLSLLQSERAYIFCLEPTSEVLSRYGITFRPVSPMRFSRSYFVQKESSEPTESMTAFMEYIGWFYRSRVR